MADCISREAVQEKLERLRDKCGNDEMTFALNWGLNLIKDIPAADVVEVVRCKDCKHYKEGKLLGPTKFCYFWQIGTGLNTADDDFCSKGERRADNGR